ncbi:MAG: hypothetical protein IT305_12835 [Chloroflexi bacterium]|nr:hypothetical protein [Chloroflexota bacterium]
MAPYPRQLSLDITPLEVSPSSDWCQRWRDGRPRWRHRSEGGFDATQYEVGPIADRTAKAYVERHHYARTYVASRLRYGLWDRRGALLGVTVLSVPVRRAVLTRPFPHLVPSHESLELGRLVLADRVAANGESWFLGRVFRLAGRDSAAGHHARRGWRTSHHGRQRAVQSARRRALPGHRTRHPARGANPCCRADRGLPSGCARRRAIRQRRPGRPVVFDARPGGLRLLARGDETGEAEGEIAAAVEGEPQSVALNSRLLVDLLDTIDGPQLELAWSSPQSPVVIREVGRGGSADLALAMPLHLPALVQRPAEAA